MNRLLPAAVLLGAAFALVGCASKVPLATAGSAPGAAGSTGAAPAGHAAATPSAAAQSSVAAVDLTRQAAAAPAADLGRFVYFEFDSDAIAGEFKPTIDSHAQRLVRDPAARLTIAGHADERGGSEYNLALGQRRAEAVVRSIVLLGGDARRIEAVSFGEERPKAEGSDEASWAKNRRAELKPR